SNSARECLRIKNVVKNQICCVMGTINKFEDLGIWKHSRVICQDIYSVITNGTLAKDWALRDQMNKSSGSIMDNIAEGFGRDGRNEFLQFLSFSKSSASELRSQLYRALDRGHVNVELFDELSRRIWNKSI